MTYILKHLSIWGQYPFTVYSCTSRVNPEVEHQPQFVDSADLTKTGIISFSYISRDITRSITNPMHIIRKLRCPYFRDGETGIYIRY